MKKEKNMNHCFGCVFLENQKYGDGTTIYYCKNVAEWVGEIVIGEDGIDSNDEDLPMRCEDFRKN